MNKRTENGRTRNYKRDFHEARWDEPMIYEMSVAGERGVIPPAASEEVVQNVGDGVSSIPKGLQRKNAPALPEVAQMRVNRHYLRLSQEVMGADVSIDIGQGTCTMKYSPKVQEHLVSRNPNIVEVHPLQNPDTMQGILEICFEVERYLKAISGMDHFSFQPGGGAHGVFANVSIVRDYFKNRGETQRNEVVTTIFSHPCDAAAPATLGYTVIDLMQDNELGYPTLEAMKSVLSEKTAAIAITNPEDTGIFNPRIKEYVDAAHAVGALAIYDQANVNGIMGITRAREAGFDLIHYNLHKTFSAPHGGMGPGCGAIGVRDFLGDYLPVPRVAFDGKKYSLTHDAPHSIGKVRAFMGNLPIVIRAYMWIRQLGAEGIREAAVCSVLNNQYLMKKVLGLRGVKLYYAEGKKRVEQCRYSWETLKKETGFGTVDVQRRLIDYGLEHYWESHHPWIVPDPFTLEPCEAYSKEDIDEYFWILEQIVNECYEQPEVIANAPHKAACHNIPEYMVDDPEKVITTWRQFLKKKRKPV